VNLAGQSAAVALFAGLVGVGELMSRYRSDPIYSIRRVPAAWAYVAINAAAGVAALLLIREFGWRFGATGDTADVWRVLVAGFAAMAVFRSSLFTARIGNQDVSVGPSLVLGALLEACDRQVDRKSAARIVEGVAERIAQLDPKRVLFTLPVVCLALMQNFPPESQAQLGADLKKIQDADLVLEEKAVIAVITLSKYLGSDMVASVLQHLQPVLAAPPTARPSGEAP
jgi:hypothetical protein